MNEHDLVNKVCNYSEFPQVAGSDRSQMPGRKTLRQPPSLQSLGHCSNASKNMNLDINQRHQATTSSNQNPLEVRLPPALESRMFGSAPAQPSTFAAQSPMLLNLLCCFMLAILTHWKIKPISRMVVDVFPMSFHIFSIKFQAFNYPQCPSHISGSNSSRARHERWTWGTGKWKYTERSLALPSKTTIMSNLTYSYVKSMTCFFCKSSINGPFFLMAMLNCNTVISPDLWLLV